MSSATWCGLWNSDAFRMQFVCSCNLDLWPGLSLTQLAQIALKWHYLWTYKLFACTIWSYKLHCAAQKTHRILFKIASHSDCICVNGIHRKSWYFFIVFWNAPIYMNQGVGNILASHYGSWESLVQSVLPLHCPVLCTFVECCVYGCEWDEMRIPSLVFVTHPLQNYK